MIKFITSTMFLGLILLANQAHALNAIECKIDIYQFDTVNDRNVLLFSDTTELIEGISRDGFLLAFSIDLLAQSIDSVRSSLMVHVVTLGNPVHNYAQQFLVEHGLPAKMNKIIGKNNIEYSLVLTPIRALEIDTSDCGYLHKGNDEFRFDPSANLNIHYIPQTLADFDWNTVKAIMEESYTQFKDLNRFDLPGKYELYLYPCKSYSILWDKRFTMMADPTRSSVYAVYNHEINSADPFLLWYVSALRHHGYSPAFLAEGYANYLSFAIYDMKEILSQGRSISIDSLLDTYSYLSADPYLSDRISATFVRYLINQYKIDNFLKLYYAADDLNLRQSIESNYGKSIAELEADWINYVDTVTIKVGQLRKFGELAEASRDNSRSLKLFKAAYARAGTKNDSLRDVSMVARGSLIAGKFEDAVKYQKQLTELDPNVPLTRMTLAGYRMMVGDYAAAAEDLQIAIKLDAGNQFIRFNNALNQSLLGKSESAIKEYESIISDPVNISAQLESRVMLAGLLRKRGSKSDLKQSEQLYNDVVGIFTSNVGRSHPQPTQQMWLGIASLGIGDTVTAQERLETALFFETRPFYLGMIHLWLGKISDFRGEHDVARDFYSLVLDQPSAEYHRQEARHLMDNPYR